MTMIRQCLIFSLSCILLTFTFWGEQKKEGESAAAVIKRIIKESTIQEAIKKFQEFKVDSQDKYSFNETEFNSLGYWLISRGKIKEAIAVFRMNIEMFPKSANVHDSLGEAYLYSGNKIRAIINYKKSLEINPKNMNAQYKLKHIDKQIEIYQAETHKVYQFANGEQTNLKGPYLGQKPPGLKAKVFAPGIVSTYGNHEFCCRFSTDGKEFYFNRGMTIMVCRWEKDGWTAPQPVKFTGKYRSHEPHITADNKQLYYGTFRPQPGNEKEKNPYGIWMVERTDKGWSKPGYVGLGMYVSSTQEGIIYVTDVSGGDLKSQGIVKTRIKNGRFGKFERQFGGVQTPAPDRFPGRHPFIAADESFIIFDAYKKPEGGEGALFVCFKKKDGSWGEAIKFSDNVNTGHNICASLSPDSKYLFYYANKDIYWVDAKIEVPKFAELLKKRNFKNLNWHYSYLEIEDHFTIDFKTLQKALERLFLDIIVARNIVKDGYEAGRERLKFLVKKFGFNEIFPEETLAKMGYVLLNQELFEDAITLFKIAAEYYLGSYLTYENLWEAYMLYGKKDLAIKNFEKSLKIYPANTYAKDMLIKLRKEIK